MRDRPLCPSAPLSTKARVIGVVTGQGEIAFLGKAIPVDQAFVQEARTGREPERRFRLAAPCARTGCANWAGQGCSLPERVHADLAGTVQTDRALPECGIRRQCVWYAQSGSKACQGCRFVVTRAAMGAVEQGP